MCSKLVSVFAPKEAGESLPGRMENPDCSLLERPRSQPQAKLGRKEGGRERW